MRSRRALKKENKMSKIIMQDNLLSFSMKMKEQVIKRNCLALKKLFNLKFYPYITLGSNMFYGSGSNESVVCQEYE